MVNRCVKRFPQRKETASPGSTAQMLDFWSALGTTVRRYRQRGQPWLHTASAGMDGARMDDTRTQTSLSCIRAEHGKCFSPHPANLVGTA